MADRQRWKVRSVTSKKTVRETTRGRESVKKGQTDKQRERWRQRDSEREGQAGTEIVGVKRDADKERQRESRDGESAHPAVTATEAEKNVPKGAGASSDE